MTKSITSIAADFTKQIADSIAIGDTTFTLNSLTDSDGVALADLKLYGFTIDTGAKKEYVVATLSSGTFTGVKSISRQGAVTTGFTKEHRIGVSAQITDHAALYRVVATLLGVNDLDAGVALKYDGAPAQTAPNALATVQFVLDTANGGAVSFNATNVAGIVGENVTAGDWVYLKESDGKWYLTDADDTAKSVNVKIGKVRATTTSGNGVAGGIFVNGQETVGTYVAGTTYYLSNTAGELATSAGTNSVIVGVGDDGGDLVFRTSGVLASTSVAGGAEEATAAEIVARTGTGATGARLFINPSTLYAALKFGGSGADGALSITSGTTTIDLAGAQYIVKNYTSISITGTGKLAFSNPHANGTTIVLKSQGDVTLTSSSAPMIDCSGLGGNNNTDGISFGTFKTKAGSGHTAASTLPTAIYMAAFHFTSTLLSWKYTRAFLGAGGYDGDAISGGIGTITASTGGRGGGCLLMECGGAWNFTTAGGISVAGKNGNADGTPNLNNSTVYGGGGGAAGFFMAIYNTLTANSGTVTVTGGSSGSNLSNGSGGSGYRGSGGGNAINLGTDGTASGGGVGATGLSFVVANTEFV